MAPVWKKSGIARAHRASERGAGTIPEPCCGAASTRSIATNGAPLNLVIVHYHFRPGGVRRVIELAAPAVCAALAADTITLVSGETPPAPWLRAFRAAVAPRRVRLRVNALLGYTDERLAPDAVRAALAPALNGPALVWAHNPGLGRNLELSRQLAALCAERDLPLVLHHHDWWCDRRWARWPVIRRTGFTRFDAVAAAIFPSRGRVAHVAINLADAAILRRHFGRAAHWLPNVVERSARPAHRPRSADPIWLLPCRVLRRKNIGEALLLTRWLRPAATLVVTGGADEADELHYAERLAAEAHAHGWPLQLSAMATRQPRLSMESFFAEAETILFTSLQEGFGLPQVEAAAAGKPAIIRRVPLVARDLARTGFRFPQTYQDVLVAPGLFGWKAEVRRQARGFREWRAFLPARVRTLAEPPSILSSPPRAVAFSRLTLEAQLEVLRWPASESWRACAPCNPLLRRWRARAATGTLAAASWPPPADAHLSATAYARRFMKAVANCRQIVDAETAGLRVQEEIIRARLDPAESFPLLWSPRGGAPTSD